MIRKYERTGIGNIDKMEEWRIQSDSSIKNHCRRKGRNCYSIAGGIGRIF